MYRADYLDKLGSLDQPVRFVMKNQLTLIDQKRGLDIKTSKLFGNENKFGPKKILVRRKFLAGKNLGLKKN